MKPRGQILLIVAFVIALLVVFAFVLWNESGPTVHVTTASFRKDVIQIAGWQTRTAGYIYDESFDASFFRVGVKICFPTTGECFPDIEDEHYKGANMVYLYGSPSKNCDPAGIPTFPEFKYRIWDSDEMGGLAVWSFYGIQTLDANGCPMNNGFIPYPHYDSTMEPDGILNRVGFFQDCWRFDFGITGLVDRSRCIASTHTTRPYEKSIAATNGSTEVMELILIGGQGLFKMVPITAFPQEYQDLFAGKSDGMINEEIKKMNLNPGDWTPIWEMPWANP